MLQDGSVIKFARLGLGHAGTQACGRAGERAASGHVNGGRVCKQPVGMQVTVARRVGVLAGDVQAAGRVAYRWTVDRHTDRYVHPTHAHAEEHV